MISSIIFGIIASTLLCTAFVMFRHYKKVNEFYGQLEDLANKFLEENENISNTFFDELVVSKMEMYLTPWEQNFDNYIIDENRFHTLIDYHKQEINKINKIVCPWCDNLDQAEFNWVVFEEELSEHEVGALQCMCCGMMTPQGTAQECAEMIKEVEPKMHEECNCG
jgi:hypothetical protein